MGPLTHPFIANQEYEENVNVTLKRLRHYDLNYVTFYYVFINPIRNKTGDLDNKVDGNIDILCIAEKKLDESFPNNQFSYQYNQSIYTGYYRKKRWLDDIC